ncbi:hypothetical protein MFRU_006g00500 [Monilinia fructicola]|nr:hypothetical protein MFRU_006g00500 [Monilinia fructicola]
MLASRSQKQYSSCFFIPLVFLVVVVVATLAYFQQIHSSSAFSSASSYSSTSNPPIPQSLNPSASASKTVVFAEHAAYENLSHVYDSLWEDLLPSNKGFWQVVVESEDERADQRVEKHKYGITMFHSLHCLGIMRMGVQELFREMEELKVEVEGSKGDMGGMGRGDGDGDGKVRENAKKVRGGTGHDFGHAEHGDPLHWLHCFDYLRQTILCNADGTLEPPKLDSRGKENVDGMGERQCRDPEELWRLSLESFGE